MEENAAITIVLTDAAVDVIGQVRAARGDDLSLVIGNGCCDSTAPYLYDRYYPGSNLHGVRVFVEDGIARSFEGREVVVDASAGDIQPDSFSCEAELGYRFSLDRLPAVQ